MKTKKKRSSIRLRFNNSKLTRRQKDVIRKVFYKVRDDTDMEAAIAKGFKFWLLYGEAKFVIPDGQSV